MIDPTDHESVQEILAGHALHALSPSEEAGADALIAGHLPECHDCRTALAELEFVAGDLALHAAPRRPPRTLEARLRREVRRPRTSPRWLQPAVASVLVLAVAGLALWNVHLSNRMSAAEQRQANTAELISNIADPNSHVVPMAVVRSDLALGARVWAAYVPGRARLYLYGFLPTPPAGEVYQVWLDRGGVYRSAGTFVPDDQGLVILRIPADPTAYDHVLITEEPTAGSPAPSARQVLVAQL